VERGAVEENGKNEEGMESPAAAMIGRRHWRRLQEKKELLFGKAAQHFAASGSVRSFRKPTALQENSERCQRW
jgi:hypothetical protein